jgi:carbon-monoxide dehydrogenase medium subunit
MIPAQFEYERPASLGEALRALTDGAGAARAIAGGQSLLPLMKLRLARPERLVDIGRFEELRGVRRLAGRGIAIGALTTWAALLDSSDIMQHAALADAIPTIGDVQVRNRGTIGGSLAHADPASDIAACLLALEAEVIVRSSRAERHIAIAELYAGPFMTALEPDELITEIHLPAPAPGSASAYVAVSHPASGYPVAGAAAVLGQSEGGRGSGGPRGSDGGDGTWNVCAVALTGVGEMPYRAPDVEAAILSGAPPLVAAAHSASGQRVLTDPYADRDYRAAMAVVVMGRAIERAAERAATRTAAPPASATGV